MLKNTGFRNESVITNIKNALMKSKEYLVPPMRVKVYNEENIYLLDMV
jgi:hypothetical protein